MAVLVVTCPCALSLATPTALAVSVGNLARRGVIATRGHAIEALSRVTHVVFDKTGTLTQGQLTLAGFELLAGSTRAHALCCGGARWSTDPSIRSRGTIAGDRRAEGALRRSWLKRCAALAGSGVEGRIDGVVYRIGTAQFVSALAGMPPPERDFGGATPVWLGSEQGWLAVFTFTDALRPEAAQVVAALQAAGKRIVILSGDEPAAVRAVAEQSGCDAAQKEACLPKASTPGCALCRSRGPSSRWSATG